ncbi:hypothetical protein GCM10009765_76150 [Fodinicola feengrottensis]|uniref:EfeO-type cupredoxin-like domain-containing protein n=1 Tax=Fodinicola feengrottensis TaxID=435914 RepID=A0ABP4V241_9ACTN
MRKWPVLAVLAAALWLVLPAAPVAAAGHTVQMKQYAFSPSALTVVAGDSVTWTNDDVAQHDVMITSGPLSFHGPLIGKGQSWTYTFGTPGTYSYVCSVHPDMTAQLVVRPKQTPSSGRVSPAATAHSSANTAARPSASASPPAAVVPAATATPQMSMPAATADTSSAGLNPLLVVAGISVAVVVFCLLLMSSRPVPVPVSAPAPLTDSLSPAHSDLADTAVLPEAGGDASAPAPVARNAASRTRKRGG